MTLLDDPPRPTTAPPSASVTLTAALAAIQAATASLVLVLAPTVLAWVTGAGSSATWSQAVRVALDAWLAALGVDVRVPGGVYGLIPLGLTLLPLLACWLSARRMARALDPNGERIAAGFGRARARPAPVRALVTFVLVWTGLVTGVAALAATPAVGPVLWQAPIGAAVVGGLGACAGAAAWTAGGLRPGLRLSARWVADLLRVPDAARHLARPAGIGLFAQLAGAAVVLACALLTSLSAIAHLQHVLDPGLTGNVVLILVQVLLLPNAVVWVAAFLAGPGFAVGAATSVTPAAAVVGPLPALPMIAALPAPGTLPSWAYGLLAVPFLAGACLGVSVGRRADHGRGPRASVRTALDAVGASALAGAGMAVVCWLSAGSAGPGRLSDTGPHPIVTGTIFAAELAVGAFAGLLVVSLIGRVARGRASTSPDQAAGASAGASAGGEAQQSWVDRVRERALDSLDPVLERFGRFGTDRLRLRRRDVGRRDVS